MYISWPPVTARQPHHKSRYLLLPPIRTHTLSLTCLGFPSDDNDSPNIRVFFLISPSLRWRFVTVLFGGRHSSAMLRGLGSYLVTEISVQSIAPVFKGITIHDEWERRLDLNGIENLTILTLDCPIFTTISASIRTDLRR